MNKVVAFGVIVLSIMFIVLVHLLAVLEQLEPCNDIEICL